MNVQLLRAAVIRVSESETRRHIEGRLGGVEIVSTQGFTIDSKPAGTLYIAKVSTTIDTSPGSTLVIPTAPRKEAEAALETIARLMAIDQQETHSLSSPMPFVGLQAEDESNLKSLNGMRVDQRVTSSRIMKSVDANRIADIDPEDFVDRLDGLALLAEALNSTSPLGRYMQLIRLFERAFKLGPSALTNPLAQFLASSPYRFAANEVRSWTEARAPSAHADRREVFYLDADVRPIVDRMLEAGYEVLLNKEVWRNRSSSRRNVWRPTTGSLGSDKGFFLTQGTGATTGFQLLDGFESYPLVLAGPFDSLLPPAAWLREGKAGGHLEILGTWS